MRTRKFAYEIYWPLIILKQNILISNSNFFNDFYWFESFFVLSLWNKHFISVESIYLKHLGLEVKMTSKWTNGQSRKHNGWFLVFLSKKYLRQISILGTNNSEIWKKGTQFTTFKIDMIKVTLFFQIFYSLVSKIDICLKYFSDKNSQKQPLWKSERGIVLKNVFCLVTFSYFFSGLVFAQL